MQDTDQKLYLDFLLHFATACIWSFYYNQKILLTTWNLPNTEWLCVLSCSGSTLSQFKEIYWIIISIPKKYYLLNNFKILNCFGNYEPLLKWFVLKYIWSFCAVLSMKMIQFLITVDLQFHFVLLVQQVMWTWQHGSLAFLQFWNRDPIFFGSFHGFGMLLILVLTEEWKSVDIHCLKTSYALFSFWNG